MTGVSHTTLAPELAVLQQLWSNPNQIWTACDWTSSCVNQTTLKGLKEEPCAQVVTMPSDQCDHTVFLEKRGAPLAADSPVMAVNANW